MNIAVRHPGCADVLGNGPAALVVAIALAQRGWEIRLIAPPKKSTHPSRIDVLGGSALATLARLGLSRDEMLAVARPCPGTWCRWSADGVYNRDFITTPHGSAWAVDRSGFQALLAKRASEAGVRPAPGDAPLPASGREAGIDCQHGNDRRWRILASGCLTRRQGSPNARDDDDRLVAIVGIGKMATAAEPVDMRLMVEANLDGWAYGIIGPGDLACLGVITDAQSLAGVAPRIFASNVLDQTERITRLRDRLIHPLTFQTVPVPCRWLPLKACSRSIRLGDAQASFDPLAGRGLWEAIRKAEEVAVALDTDQDQIVRIEQESRNAYQRYLAERLDFYRSGRSRFGTGFWLRRCSPPSMPWKTNPQLEPSSN